MPIADNLPAQTFEIVFGNLLLEEVLEREREGMYPWVAEQVVMQIARQQGWERAALQAERALVRAFAGSINARKPEGEAKS